VNIYCTPGVAGYRGGAGGMAWEATAGYDRGLFSWTPEIELT